MAVLDLLLGRPVASDEAHGEQIGPQGLANVDANCYKRMLIKKGWGNAGVH